MPRVILWLAALALMATGCAGGEPRGAGGANGGGERLRVVAAFYPLAEAAQQVGGDRVDVVNLTPPGAEPHDVELSPRQVDTIEDADVVLYLGRRFQPAVEEVARRSGGVAVDLLAGRPLVAGEGGIDPHVWLDPHEMRTIVERVRDALKAADRDPAAAEAYRARAAAFLARLDSLDGDYRARLASCERRTIVTAHAAFAYLARRYELSHEAVAGLAPESEPDPRRLAELADQVRAAGVTTIFYETLVSPAIAQTLAREVGVKTAVLNPLEGLTNEQLRAGQNYESVMRDNLAALTEALGCR